MPQGHLARLQDHIWAITTATYTSQGLIREHTYASDIGKETFIHLGVGVPKHPVLSTRKSVTPKSCANLKTCDNGSNA